MALEEFFPQVYDKKQRCKKFLAVEKKVAKEIRNGQKKGPLPNRGTWHKKGGKKSGRKNTRGGGGRHPHKKKRGSLKGEILPGERGGPKVVVARGSWGEFQKKGINARPGGETKKNTWGEQKVTDQKAMGRTSSFG